MKLVSFEIQTALGAHYRIGALNESGQIVDLQLAYRQVLTNAGATETAAERIAAAVIPSSMVEFIRGGQTSMGAARSAVRMGRR